MWLPNSTATMPRKNLSSTWTAALYFYMLACGLSVKWRLVCWHLERNNKKVGDYRCQHPDSTWLISDLRTWQMLIEVWQYDVCSFFIRCSFAVLLIWSCTNVMILSKVMSWSSRSGFVSSGHVHVKFHQNDSSFQNRSKMLQFQPITPEIGPNPSK